jgi:hypothetical protein
MTEPIAFFHPHKGFYWAKPTKITAPVCIDVKPLKLYTQSPQWIGLDQTTKPDIRHQTEAFFAGVQWAETRLKELNT